MATESSLAEVLKSFTDSSEAALNCLPEVSTLIPPENGITLLDAKTEIFLSYLQALALRNLSVIRSIKNGGDVEGVTQLSTEVTKKLNEHRVYLERGVRALEQKIKYQVEKVVKAAEEEERAKAQNDLLRKTANGRHTVANIDGPDSADSSGDESNTSAVQEIDAMTYRPDASSFLQPGADDLNSARRTKMKQDGVYRPPRVSATVMPTTESRERKERKPGRSTTMDEYISTELSNAPMAEPSIGSTIIAGGRRTKNARQLAAEMERKEYEETNLVRLPKESKKERARRERGSRTGFGGEEWQTLGESLNRISDLTRKKKDTAFEKSLKRKAVEDSSRDIGMGRAFEVVRRREMKKAKR
ncbi:hypothetical protein M433DRAFT_157906 [Acidomyces richmondensis BFW]|nr:MAG: hypothetical protein FE78DRAFT_84601 [Acidomyces sp. 'richmondensis']KYG42424.1 hypothetical protein M433DRAFT_157906 [Acidomyces richmondensis BFW]